jgi:hypothetical protein
MEISMKLTKIAFAVAALVAAQNASAFDVYVSGASALRDTMPRLMERFCQPDSGATPRALREVGADKDRRAYSCTFHTAATNAPVAAELGTLAGKQVNVYHSVEPGDAYNNLVGGSITGIIPLLANSTAVMNFSNLDGAANGNDTTFVAPKYNSTQAPHVPEIGVSDVEPKLFTAAYANLPTDAGAVAAGWKLPAGANPAALVHDVAFIGSMGVAVTLNDYNAGVTNVSMDQLANILSGDLYNWNQVGGPNLDIKVCTRAPGSGTKATFNALVNHKGCGANLSGTQFAVATQADLGVDFVEEASTTGGVIACLENANAQGLSAIGIVGLENASKSNPVSASAQWRFIDVNGVHVFDPAETAGNTLDGTVDNLREETIINGTYPLWIESVVVKSAKVSLGADQTAFYNLLKDKAGDPIFTKTLPGIVSEASKRTTKTNNLLGGASNFTRNKDTCAPAKYVP